MLNVFGANGFIGKAYTDKYLSIKIDRNALSAPSGEALYFISTVDNYNVFSNPYLDIDTNLTHLIKVLENNKDTCTVFNFISSWFVYGDQKVIPVDEQAYCNPKGFYSITKRAAEQLLISYCTTFKIPYRILRLANVYGEKDTKVSKKKNALQYLINQLKDNKDIDLYHGGDFIRDYLYIDDCIDSINTVLSKGNINEIYNIGSNESVKFIDIINKAKDITKSNSKINNIYPTEFHNTVQVKDMLLNSNKLFNLGFKPKIKILSGIEKVIT